MAQAQLNTQKDINIQDLYRAVTGSQVDTLHISDRTKKLIADHCHRTTAAGGICSVEDCSQRYSSKRMAQEHVFSHFIIYLVDCGYITSRRDSATKHIKTCHDKHGHITQFDNSSWNRIRQQDASLPETCPKLPLNVRSLGERCRKARQMDVTPASLPNPPKKAPLSAVTVRRINISRSVPQPTETNQNHQMTQVEPAPIVIVEKQNGLKRQLSKRLQDVKDLERLLQNAREDVVRLRGQLANLAITDTD